MSGSPGDRFGAGNRERERWMWFLQRLGVHRHVLNTPMGTGVIHPILRPRLEQHVHTFLHPRTTLFLWHAVAEELQRAVAAAQTDGQASATENVECGGFL